MAAHARHVYAAFVMQSALYAPRGYPVTLECEATPRGFCAALCAGGETIAPEPGADLAAEGATPGAALAALDALCAEFLRGDGEAD